MASKSEAEGSSLDAVKWAVAIAALAAGVGAFYFYPEYPLPARVLALLITVGVAGGFAVWTTRGRRAWDFTREARSEVRRVVWPTRTETIQTTLIVLAVVVLVGVFLWLLDMLLLWGVQQITG